MKKGWKIFWAACGICAGVGLICCMASLVLGVTAEAIESRFPAGIGIVKGEDGKVWSIGARRDLKSAEDIHENYTEIHSIDADVWALEVEVRTASEGTEEIVLQTEDIPEKLELKCYIDEGELKIESADEVWELKDLGYMGSLVLYIPEDYQLEEVHLDNSAGYLYIEDMRAKELSVDIGAGEAVIDNMTAGEMNLNCGAGTITVSGDIEQKSDIECGIGEVIYYLPGQQSDYNYDITCEIGEVICGNDEYTGISSSRKIDNGALKDINVECGIGSVAINFEEEM